MGARLEQLNQWLKRDLGLPAFDIAPASGDASFRRYFRVRRGDQTAMLMGLITVVCIVVASFLAIMRYYTKRVRKRS